MEKMITKIKAGLNGVNNTNVGLNLDVITATNCNFYLLYSGKGVGKSYAIRERVFGRFIKYNDEFVLVRRREVDCKPSNIKKYFAKVDVKKLTNNEYDSIGVQSNEIYLCKNDSDNKPHRERTIGYVISLAQFERFKGADYPYVSTIVNEEFISEYNDYISDESTIFMKMINTVFRPLTRGEYDTLSTAERERYSRREVWLIGNTISRLCPYFRDFNLQNILKQQPNTIDIYTYTYPNDIDELTNAPREVRLACWYIGENQNGNKKSHGFVFGKGYDSIVKGQWQCDIYSKLEYPHNEYKLIYEFIVKADVMFRVQLLQHNGEFTLYVFPHTNQYVKVKRIITPVYSTSLYISNMLYKSVEVEKYIISLIQLNRIAYSDNLTGTEFQKYKNQIINGMFTI